MKALLEFRKVIFLFLFLFALLVQYNYAQESRGALSILNLKSDGFTDDTTAEKFYPLRVGNSWTYNTYFNSIPTGRYKKTVTDSALINGHIFYNIYTRSLSGNITFEGAFRVDSVYGRILLSTTNGCGWTPNEVIRDSLRAQLTDSFNVSCTNRGVCYALGSANLFGNQVQSITHNYQMGQISYSTQYARRFGIYYSSSSYTGTAYSTLIGCVISGQVYGDTTLVGLSVISVEIPEKYSLSQNYPNPFNPVTTIRFDIPPYKGGNRDVSLKVFDILGREVSTLVNESLIPGTYEVTFDASNKSSGVYYYKLNANGFSDTKKMVVMK